MLQVRQRLTDRINVLFVDAFKEAHDFLKGIDIVVNAAGILDGAHWEKEVVTNVVSTRNFTKSPSLFRFHTRLAQFDRRFLLTSTQGRKDTASGASS